MPLTRVVGPSKLLTDAYEDVETMGAKANIVGILLTNTDEENAVRPHVHLVPTGGAEGKANAIYNDEIPAGGMTRLKGRYSPARGPRSAPRVPESRSP